jgi:hypothetical protein
MPSKRTVGLHMRRCYPAPLKATHWLTRDPENPQVLGFTGDWSTAIGVNNLDARRLVWNRFWIGSSPAGEVNDLF